MSRSSRWSRAVVGLGYALSLGLAGGGCGGAGPAAPDPVPPSAPAKPELQRRQEAACEALGPRLTQCALADAKATMTKAELAKLDLEHTAPRHTAEFVEKCRAQSLSSRQVRVYEVCLREERECEPLLACLDHAKPQP